MTDKNLCDSCKFAKVLTGESRTLRFCSRMSGDFGTANFAVDFPIYKCTEYEKRGTLALHEMQEVALYLSPNPKNQIGFSWLTEDQFRDRKQNGEKV